MTEKFTPGEWHSGIDAEDKRPYIFSGDSPQEIIADVFVTNQCIEQATANAALIAAAPDLFECVCDALTDLQMPEGMRNHFEQVLKKARGEE